MKMRICFGLTALFLTSAFFTQLLQDNAWMARRWGLDWRLQFLVETGIGLLATFIGISGRRPRRQTERWKRRNGMRQRKAVR